MAGAFAISAAALVAALAAGYLLGLPASGARDLAARQERVGTPAYVGNAVATAVVLAAAVALAGALPRAIGEYRSVQEDAAVFAEADGLQRLRTTAGFNAVSPETQAEAGRQLLDWVAGRLSEDQALVRSPVGPEEGFGARSLVADASAAAELGVAGGELAAGFEDGPVLLVPRGADAAAAEETANDWLESRARLELADFPAESVGATIEFEPGNEVVTWQYFDGATGDAFDGSVVADPAVLVVEPYRGLYPEFAAAAASSGEIIAVGEQHDVADELRELPVWSLINHVEPVAERPAIIVEELQEDSLRAASAAGGGFAAAAATMAIFALVRLSREGRADAILTTQGWSAWRLQWRVLAGFGVVGAAAIVATGAGPAGAVVVAGALAALGGTIAGHTARRLPEELRREGP